MYTLTQLQSIYKQYIAEHQFNKQPVTLYEPIDYLLSLGGKSMRPTLLLLACNLYNENITAALPTAYAVELFHNFSLMHDDIMDNSYLRRGKATVHVRYNNNTAILSGDAMLVYAYNYISRVDKNILAAVLQSFNTMAVGVCEGQQLDMDMAAAPTASVENYINMIELKTAVLLEASLYIGALIGGAAPEQATILGKFGLYLGISFQIQDDYLDTFGQSAQVGKRIGGDILENKKTYLWLKAVELSDENQLQALQELILIDTKLNPQAEQSKIDKMITIYKQLNIEKETQELSKHYYNLAINCLAQLQLPSEKLLYLQQFAADLLNRNS